MKILFSLGLAILLFGGTVTDAYSQDMIPSSYQMLLFKNKATIAHFDDVDNHQFSQDQHIEESEFVFEDNILNRKLLYKYNANRNKD